MSYYITVDNRIADSRGSYVAFPVPEDESFDNSSRSKEVLQELCRLANLGLEAESNPLVSQHIARLTTENQEFTARIAELEADSGPQSPKEVENLQYRIQALESKLLDTLRALELVTSAWKLGM